jgi:3-oxoacyl-[acyl-carrier protein] reductase
MNRYNPARPDLAGRVFRNRYHRQRLLETTDIDNRLAIVTGASRGIGREIARTLAADGMHVVGLARSADALESLVEEISTAGGSAEFRICDIGDTTALGELIEEIASANGRIDVLVNNAGITRDGLILRMSDADFDEVINVNLRAVFAACRAASRPMMRARYGRIVNIGSVSGITGNPGQANYAAAKAGVIGLTKTIAKELGGKGITANVIAPGFIKTEMTNALGTSLEEEVVPRTAVKRLGEARDIASAVSWVASEGASYLTGQVIVVDGGLAL